MSQLSQYIVHNIALNHAVAQVRFATVEDYRLVSGLTQSGQFIHPEADPAYLVPCGILGLAYTSTLGRGGAAIVYKFALPVVAVQVATSSNLPPVVDVVLPSRVSGVQGTMGKSAYDEDKVFVIWPAHPADEVLPEVWYKSATLAAAEGVPNIASNLLDKTAEEIRAMGWNSYDAFGEQS